ncbi:MAG: hypothetical protein A2Y03_07650 [Omnitrophica WOR_2 bacterium GWF2_38_59]|nr:MAG: hypothetical protein A2Y03_07650 [Omnitrophica WOR_2 bacterium GWF2_38_59]OGX49442.1 MAG: hypothetical protein A2243_09525 [Omnitrophica WOR_2 bacterium RIFOXYA2_FULL_38_17]OGX54842.1 MAG: hypothetical protein A2267_07330 [Omnitrophica WOR_2 bacterium RIFOXYA12_FULL_38_10]OGX55947.1 MAG: hypothetical protein A2306_12450 [Omnitrophica WOR_2 bacterium RIFOXYB2_FULL_38_16]HBG62456.1 uracil-DNA glycosylase [Candidatus Omnitrophota bacterium]
MMSLEEKKLKIEKLRGKISCCKRCALFATRTNVVPGEGDCNADIMFIGEAPGRNEDLKGKPFVGRAGDVFDKLLDSVGLTRQQIYLCNILKCRPPGNRNPLSSEIKSCVGSLDIQIKVVDPQVIGTLGNFSTTYIFEKFGIPAAKISAVAGKVFDVDPSFGKIKIVPLFHPAVATYNVHKTDQLINDFQIFKRFISSKKISVSNNEDTSSQMEWAL